MTVRETQNWRFQRRCSTIDRLIPAVCYWEEPDKEACWLLEHTEVWIVLWEVERIVNHDILITSRNHAHCTMSCRRQWYYLNALEAWIRTISFALVLTTAFLDIDITFTMSTNCTSFWLEYHLSITLTAFSSLISFVLPVFCLVHREIVAVSELKGMNFFSWESCSS